jgi:peptidoglycan/LPS O-acetylase OafA/YrhL
MFPRFVQLDGVRAVAVTLVMAFHFVPGVDRYAPLGSIGVRLFFVLSGFLITRILLQSRSWQAGYALRIFYARRALRIFPLFYVVLALAFVVDIGPVRQTIGWHVTYLTNLYLFERGNWHGSISHLWSLAVEEQFYLIWPILMLTVPERRLPALLVATIVAAPITRLMLGGPMDSVLPTSCLDSLGAGALLAFPAARQSMMRVGVAAGLPLLAVSLAIRGAGLAGEPVEIALDVGVSLASAWIVGSATQGFGGYAGRFLAARPVVYLGTISYGVYLFHGFMPYVLGRYVRGFVEMPWPLRAALLTMATITIASVSWRVFEKPLLALKPGLRKPVPHAQVGVARA